MDLSKVLGFLGKLIRASEWWEHKLAVLVAVAYATALLTKTPLTGVALPVLFYLAALSVAATYVSLINDFTDIEEDLAVGKSNKMAKLSIGMRWILLLTCLGIGIIFLVFMWPDFLAVTLYAATWVVFSLYSIRPFRFKERGILGVLCDATGAHFFPSLLMVAGISHAAGVAVDWYWFALVAIWALMFGVRGILWHQYLDMENDKKTHIRTFATQINVNYFRSIAIGLFGVELIAFVAMLFNMSFWSGWIALGLYLIVVWIRYTRYANVPIILVTPKNKTTQVIMLDYYQTFFPISLLLMASFTQPWAWMVLVSHLLLFPGGVAIALKDYWMAIDALYRQLRYSS